MSKKIKYNEPGDDWEIFAEGETLRPSALWGPARKTGFRLDAVAKGYSDLQREFAEMAKETDAFVIYDVEGLYRSQDSNSDYCWDIIYRVVTPEGEYKHLRKHYL